MKKIFIGPLLAFVVLATAAFTFPTEKSAKDIVDVAVEAGKFKIYESSDASI